uniref:Ig-like domain-containing protein n=1 Tax=Salarias fasciatus TaxID=181472 RepID=A0A672G912_SALFA
VMASLTLALCLSFLLTWKMVPGQKLSSSDRQERSFVSAHAGEDLTLRCFYDTQVPTSIYWYKQILGQRPKLISVSSKNDKNLFHGEIENSTHFKMDKRDGKALLTITDLHTSDSAIYHCIFYSYVSPIFSESVTVSVKGFGSNATLVNQPVSDSIQPGGFATLSCTVHPGSCDGEHSVYWYKKSEESLPVLFYTHVSSKNDKNLFHGEIENSTRFKMDKRDGKALLKITDLHTSDSAIYHCILYSYISPIFSESVTVSVKGFGSNATLVNQPGSDSIQPGGFATLSCTVHPGSCDGEHSVYWYKKSEESLPVVFYTHGGMNDQCDSQSNTCFYELPMENLTQADAGMYYCAVASCGQVLFGNGTKLDFPDKVNPWVLVHLLSWALLFTMIFSIFLAISLYNITKKNSCHSTGNLHSLWNLHYAALSLKKTNRPRRHGNASNDECVYSNA